MKTFTLTELAQYLQQVIALNFSEELWVTAEIQQWKNANGHFFITLTEPEKDQLEVKSIQQAVLWNGQQKSWPLSLQKQISQIIREGNDVRLQVRIDFHPRFGLKLIILNLDPSYTMGKLLLRRAEILQTLRAEGMLNQNKQLFLPINLQRIALVSSPQAAGLQDFMAEINHNDYHFKYDVQLFPARVQGVQSAGEIAQQIQKINRKHERFDVIVILRGGGSKNDLIAFDQLELAKAVATAALPVITGIGHEKDESVLDTVAYKALKTPTAVAHFLIKQTLLFESKLDQVFSQLIQTTTQRIHTENNRLNQLQILLRQTATTQKEKAKQALSLRIQKLYFHFSQRISRQEQQLTMKTQHLKLHNPLYLLKKGFTLTLINEKPIAQSNPKPGDRLKTISENHTIESKVDQIKPHEKNDL